MQAALQRKPRHCYNVAVSRLCNHWTIKCRPQTTPVTQIEYKPLRHSFSKPWDNPHQNHPLSLSQCCVQEDVLNNIDLRGERGGVPNIYEKECLNARKKGFYILAACSNLSEHLNLQDARQQKANSLKTKRRGWSTSLEQCNSIQGYQEQRRSMVPSPEKKCRCVAL